MYPRPSQVDNSRFIGGAVCKHPKRRRILDISHKNVQGIAGLLDALMICSVVLKHSSVPNLVN